MPQKEFENIVAVNRFLKLTISKEKDLQNIVNFAADICETPFAMINFLDRDIQHTAYSVGIQPTEIQYKNAFCSHTIKQYEVLVIPDTLKDFRFETNRYVVDHPGIRFYAGAPLTTADGINLGTLCVLDNIEKKLSGLQIQMLKSLSRQIINLLDFETSLSLLKDQFVDSRNAENTLLAFFESSSSCHLLLDTQLKIVSFNKAFSDIIFTSFHKIFTDKMEVTEYIHPDFLVRFKKSYYAALQGKSITEELHLDLNGSRSCWLVTFDPARNPDQEIIGVAYNATDITKSVEHEELLRLQDESIKRIEHIQKNDLVESIRTINAIMNNISVNNSSKYSQEIQLLAHSVAELNDKSRIIV